MLGELAGNYPNAHTSEVRTHLTKPEKTVSENLADFFIKQQSPHIDEEGFGEWRKDLELRLAQEKMRILNEGNGDLINYNGRLQAFAVMGMDLRLFDPQMLSLPSKRTDNIPSQVIDAIDMIAIIGHAAERSTNPPIEGFSARAVGILQGMGIFQRTMDTEFIAMSPVFVRSVMKLSVNQSPTPSRQ